MGRNACVVRAFAIVTGAMTAQTIASIAARILHVFAPRNQEEGQEEECRWPGKSGGAEE